MFLVDVFEEKAQLLQWLVFFRSTRSVHFFVHLCNFLAEVNPDASSNIMFQSSDVNSFKRRLKIINTACNPEAKLMEL